MGKNTVGGVGSITVGSRQILARANVSIRIGGKVRETVAGLDGVHGYTETHQAWRVSFDASAMRQLDLQWLKTVDEETVLVELLNGKQAKLFDAWFVGDLELNAGDGQATVALESREGSLE